MNEFVRVQWLSTYQYTLNLTNLLELNIWKHVKRKPKFNISFNGNQAVTKKEFSKPTKQAITIKKPQESLHTDEMRELTVSNWVKLSSLDLVH